MELVRGIPVDGKNAFMKQINYLRNTVEGQWYRIILTQGMKRQIKRMIQHFDAKVKKIFRVSFAGIPLGHINPGQYRNLSPFEIKTLKKISGQ